MPAIDASQLVPYAPLHWTTILHYLMILGALVVMTIASEKNSTLFTILVALFAVTVGANLYSNLINLERIFIFLIRVVMFALPIVLAGMATLEEVRNLSVLLAVLAFPILVMTIFTCWFGPVIGDPRVYSWCSL